MNYMSTIWVTAAKVLPGYRLRVHFSDGTEGEVALHEFVFKDPRPIVAALREHEFVFKDPRPIVAALRDPGKFADVRVELDTVVWANGFDLAPEFLYANKTAYA
jgi:hypothetical protein